jgi:hypothetical protein
MPARRPYPRACEHTPVPSTPLLDNSIPGYFVHAYPTDPAGPVVETADRLWLLATQRRRLD